MRLNLAVFHLSFILEEVSVIYYNHKVIICVHKPFSINYLFIIYHFYASAAQCFLKSHPDNWKPLPSATSYSMLLLDSQKPPTTKMSFTSVKIYMLFLFDTFNLKCVVETSIFPSFLYS